MTAHTIILYQKNKSKASRTFNDYETVQLAVEGIIRMYEQRLQELNPHIRQLSYELKDLHAYIDYVDELAALVYEPSITAYLPRDKQWIKDRIASYLKKATRRQ